VLLASSNARTWTPIQEGDLAFRVVAAKFAPVTKTFPFGTVPLVDCSDMLIRAAIELATGEASVIFEVVRPNGEILRLAPWQWLPLDAYLTESVNVRAVLTGTDKISPIMYPGVTFIAGKIRASGTYVTRAFKMGTAIRVTNYFKGFIPSGSSLTVEIDAADDNWQAVPQVSISALDGGWTDRKHQKDPFTAIQGRLRMTINGSPAARPKIADYTAVVI
jgi:hypothetical protein